MKVENYLKQESVKLNPQHRGQSCDAIRRPIACLLVAALGLLPISCSKKSSVSTAAKSPAPVPVLVAKAVARDIPVEISSIGTVEAFSLVSVRSQITGKILEVHFEQGQEVKAGDLLVSLDPRQWEAELNQAQANLKRDEAQIISARLTFLRTSNLFESKIASQQDYDMAEAGYRALEATLLADAAAISNAQVNLDYTFIRSPIDGKTGSVSQKSGNVVKALDDVIVTITQTKPVYVAYAVPEKTLSAIRRRAAEAKLPVRAFAPEETNNVAVGDLTFIDNRVDTNTGMIQLKGTFDNSHHVLWPGQFVRAVMTLSNLVQATVVPTQAVESGQNGEYVFVVNPDQTVVARPVVAGLTYDGLRVIAKGVEAGDTVVTDGQLRLTSGARVNINTPDSTSVLTSTGAVTSTAAR